MFAAKSKKPEDFPQRTKQNCFQGNVYDPVQTTPNDGAFENRVAMGGRSLIDEMREMYGWGKGGIRTSAGVPLPSALKKEYEEQSGVSLDDVQVHYNSDQPERFGAEAFAYGENIFLKPAQESLITHELGHVVQQKWGLVNTTHNENSYPVNNDETLEKQADKPVNPVGRVSRVKVRKVAKPVMQFARAIVRKRQPAKRKTQPTKKIERPRFSKLVYQLYPSSRKHETSVDHVISFENIRIITEEIAKLPPEDRIYHLRRLIKAVMPILNATEERDTKNRLDMLTKWINQNQDISDERVQAEFLADMNNSLSNLRLGNASLNSAIGKRLDPIIGTFILSGNDRGIPKVNFSSVNSDKTSDKFARVKSVHKLVRLATELKDKTLLIKPVVAKVPGTRMEIVTLSSDNTRANIPKGVPLIVPQVVVFHRKKDKVNRPSFISRYIF